MKRFWIYFGISGFAVILIVTACIMFRGYDWTKKESIPAGNAQTEIVVVASERESVFADLCRRYDAENDHITVKLININGTREDVHRFYVSTLVDELFYADVLLMDDVWLSEFAGDGFLAELPEIKKEEFISAAQKGMMHQGKVYGIPIYADAMARYEKYQTDDEVVYLTENTEDMTAHIQNLVNQGSALEAAYDTYSKAEKIQELSDFAENDIAVMETWLSQNDLLLKYYSKSVRVRINVPENTLIKSKLAVVSQKSKVKPEAIEFINYLLENRAQAEIVETMTVIPIMNEQYQSYTVKDWCPYINQSDGSDFTTARYSSEYNVLQGNLTRLFENEASSEELLALFNQYEKDK